jgi:hypothetical protein
MVVFSQYREGNDRYLVRAYSVVVDNTGTVIADPDVDMPLPGDGIEAPEQLLGQAELYDTKGHQYYWTHEERAKYLPERHAIPDAEAIPEAEAIRIAWEVAQNHEQIIPEKLAGYETIALYCPAEAQTFTTEPFWEIVLIDEDPNAGPAGTTYGAINIMLNYRSGEVVYVYGFGDAYISNGGLQ